MGECSKKSDHKTSSGDTQIEAFSGRSLQIDSHAGDQKLNRIQVEKFSSTKHSGDLQLNSSRALKTTMKSSSGDIHVQNFISQDSTLRTTSSDIKLENYSGNLHATGTLGSIWADFVEEGEAITLRTTSKGASIFLHDEAEFQIRTRTSSDRVNISFPITQDGSYDRKNMSASVGEGKGLIQIRTNSGNIALKKR